ncbi:unnamed protein product [Schistosoma turkestanicum]|nr:unnamed protein product [Schistosoma turkestanicum]
MTLILSMFIKGVGGFHAYLDAMKISCGYKRLQVLLVIFNCGAFICGLGLTIFGAIRLHPFFKQLNDINLPLQSIIILIMTVGCFFLILGALGIIGAFKMDVRLLNVHCVLLLILIIFEIAVVIFAFTERSKFTEYVTDELTEFVKVYNEDEHVKNTLDSIQKTLKCCGATSPADYGDSSPKSCYDNDLQFTMGCIQIVSQKGRNYLESIIISVFLLALIQIISMIFSVCVLVAINRGEYE